MWWLNTRKPNGDVKQACVGSAEIYDRYREEVQSLARANLWQCTIWVKRAD